MVYLFTEIILLEDANFITSIADKLVIKSNYEDALNYYNAAIVSLIFTNKIKLIENVPLSLEQCFRKRMKTEPHTMKKEDIVIRKKEK